MLVAKNPLNYDTFGDFRSSLSLSLSFFLHDKFSDEKETLNAIHYRLSRFLSVSVIADFCLTKSVKRYV